ncbi:MAG: hypothetical protein FJ030_19295 [Chloroflexi bacterium]|nr:hypothetical protein [Chloroflexota bacterium]
MRAHRWLLPFAVLLAACGGQPSAFPTAGVTVQAFPNVEIILPSSTLISTFTPPPSDTPLPTLTGTPQPTDPAPPTLTSTPLIQLAPPTATFPAAPTLRPTRTTAPTPTSASAAPLRFRGVSFVSNALDPSRPPDGSIVTLSVEFTGSRPPFAVKHDNLIGSVNANGDGSFIDAGVVYTFVHFRIARTCGGPIPGTVTVTGGDGQTFTHDYYVSDSPCQ